MAATKTYLTGVKPTGEPHLGNYLGAIKPALEAAREYDAFYFIADYHALTTVRDPEAMRHNIRSVAATWLACGLDPARVTFYRQSDIPEIPQQGRARPQRRRRSHRPGRRHQHGAVQLPHPHGCRHPHH